MKKLINSIFGMLIMSMLISCGSTSGVRVTRDSVTVLDGSGVGDDTTGEKRKVKASNEFANVEIEYESGTKTQSATVKDVATGLIALKGIELGIEAVKEGGNIASELIDTQ